MISIQASLTELDRAHQLRQALVDIYLTSINDVGQYALDLDQSITGEFRKKLTGLTEELSRTGADALEGSGAALRETLRDFRDRGSAYLSNLRDELNGTAKALEKILDGLTQSGGDSEQRMRGALDRLKGLATSREGGAMGTAVAAATLSIETCLDQMRKQHQVMVSQFQTEIKMLHKRIDTLETAASKDLLTRLATRAEIVERIRATPAGGYCLVLSGVIGLLRAEVQHGKDAGEDLAGAFIKRLRSGVPPTAIVGRWGAEQFVVMDAMKQSSAVNLGKWITGNLGGAYCILKAGKPARPILQPMVAVIEATPQESSDQILRRVDLFFGTSD
jgi:GGDEF domain-containing protein